MAAEVAATKEAVKAAEKALQEANISEGGLQMKVGEYKYAFSPCNNGSMGVGLEAVDDNLLDVHRIMLLCLRWYIVTFAHENNDAIQRRLYLLYNYHLCLLVCCYRSPASFITPMQ